MASRGAVVFLVVLVLGVSGASAWWARRHDDRLGAQVAALARPGDIRMIGSVTCAVCVQARHWFDSHRIAYRECLIERDADCRAEFDARQAPGTPLFVVRGMPQLGFRPERLLAALQRGGA